MWGILIDVKCTLCEKYYKEKKWIPQTQSKVLDAYNAIAQSYNAHRSPYNMEGTDDLHTEIFYRIKR